MLLNTGSSFQGEWIVTVGKPKVGSLAFQSLLGIKLKLTYCVSPFLFPPPPLPPPPPSGHYTALAACVYLISELVRCRYISSRVVKTRVTSFQVRFAYIKIYIKINILLKFWGAMRPYILRVYHSFQHQNGFLCDNNFAAVVKKFFRS